MTQPIRHVSAVIISVGVTVTSRILLTRTLALLSYPPALSCPPSPSRNLALPLTLIAQRRGGGGGGGVVGLGGVSVEGEALVTRGLTGVPSVEGGGVGLR